MTHTNIFYRILASLVFSAFLSNTLAPTIQYTFAASTQYYVDATLGNNANDWLSPATPWRSVAFVNGQTFSQGDTVSFLCGESWTGALDSFESGIFGSPITYNSYGTWCTTANRPQIENMSISSASFVNIDNLKLLSSSWSAGVVNNSNNINVTNSQFSFSGNTLTDLLRIISTDTITISGNSFSWVASQSISGIRSTSSTSVIVDNNNFDDRIHDAININNSNSTIQNNIIQYNYYGIFMTWTGINLIQSNTFPYKFGGALYSAIAMSPNTTIQNNIFYSPDGWFPCIAGNTVNLCWVIQNYNTGTIYNSTIINNYIEYSSADGIWLSSVDSVNISSNIIKYISASPWRNGIHLIDSSNTAINSNTILNAQRSSVLVIQNTPGTVANVTMNSNTLFQRNVEYPYIEMRDETPGTGTASLITANGNNFVTLYKPDTSYVRSIKFGWESVEYATKSSIILFDPSATIFQSFGYKPYTNTGSYVTANLLTNPSFETDISGWTPSASIWLAPTLTQKVSWSYSWSSMMIAPQDSTPSHMYITNNSILSITGGQVYEVSGYLKSSVTGSLNIKWSLHRVWFSNQLYSDSTAETYSTSTGRSFLYYIYANTTATDAQFALEISNQNIPLEIDEMSIRRKNIVQKNTNVNEVLVLVNTGSTSISQSCPSGVPCAQYVDTSNATTGWPTLSLSLPAHSASLALWNNSPNLVTVPTVSMTIDSGSIPSGTLAHVSWIATGSTQTNLAYTTVTGSVNIPASNIWDIYFEPPTGATSTTYLYTQNEIGSRINQVDVTTTNTPPVVFPVSFSGNEDDPLIIGTLSGVDYNPGDTVFFDQFVNPPNGSLSIDISGTASYIPNPNFCGVDTFMYRAYDQYSNYADPVSASLVVNCVNDAPVAVNDSMTVTGALTNFDVLANDTDPDSPYVAQTLSLSGFTQTIHGSVIINGNQFQYAVNNGYIWPDSFTYSLQDQSGALSNTGTVNITVSVPNTPPTDSGAVYVTNEDTNFMGTLSWTDINPDTLSFTVSTLPLHGTVSLIGSSFTYTPTLNYNWTDTFIYQVFDGSAYSSWANIDFNITSVPDAPVVVNDAFSLVQDTSFFVPVMNNDYDVDSLSGQLTLTGFSNPTNGSISPTSSGFLYTPTTGYSGSNSFTYRLIDETSLLSNLATVTLTVAPSNTPPVATWASLSLNEDTSLTGTFIAADPESATLTYTLDTLPTSGTVSLNGTWGFVYTPNPNSNGSDSFSFHVNDGMFNSNSAMISLTIIPVNDAPVASNASQNIAGNSYASSGNIFNGTLSGSDIDSMILTYTASTLPVHWLLNMTSTGVYAYTPAYGYTGTDSFTFRIDDGQAVSNTGTVDFMISGINSAPLASSGSFVTNEDTLVSFTLSGSDPDGNGVTYVLDTSTPSGILSLQSSGTVNFSPALNYNGTLSFTYHVTDGLLPSPIQTVKIDVLPVNDAPIAASGSFTITGNVIVDNTHTLVFTGIATDVDSTIFIFTSATLPAQWTLAMTASGVFTYTPNIGYVGGDNFSYRANDGIANSNPAVVNITMSANATNTAPIASSGSFTTNEDTLKVFTLSGSDPDGNPITYVLDTSVATGTLSLQASGTVNFTPALNYNGTLSFTYHVTDGSLSSASKTVTLTVLPVNDVPIANNVAYNMTGNIVSNSGNVLSGMLFWTDVDSVITGYAQIGSPSHGILAFNASGSFIYTPTIGYFWSDSFTYTVSDGLLTSSTGMVTIRTIDPTQAVIIQGPIVWNGGGWGGSSSAVSGGDTFTSAPNTPRTQQHQTINGTVFTMANDSTGLASQLLLMNRELTASGLKINHPDQLTITPSETVTSAQSALETMLPRLSLVDDTAVYLRAIIRHVLWEAEISNNPVWAIDNALIQIQLVSTNGDVRLTLTKEFALRILKFHQRMYEEMTNRDLNSAPSSSTSRNQSNESTDLSSDPSLDALLGQLSF